MLKQLNEKTEELELQLAGSKWFLPVAFVIAFIAIAFVYSILFVAFAMEEEFELNRPQYDLNNEVYELETLIKR